jgi:hypothetical protein
MEAKEKKNVVIMPHNIVPHMLHTSTKIETNDPKIWQMEKRTFSYCGFKSTIGACSASLVQN